MLLRVVVATNDSSIQRRIQRLIPTDTCDVESVPKGRSAWDRLMLKSADVVIVSRAVIPNPPEESIATMKMLPDGPDIFVLDADEDAEWRARLLGAGVGAVLNPTLPAAAIRSAIAALLERRREHLLGGGETRGVLDQPRLSDFVSKSPVMQRFLGIAQRLVNNDSTILLTGETGVGKEYLARAIHSEGPRANAAFVSVNCGALPETLLESELFGHEEGAFTGANRTRRGRFELAHQGTIFLDEIGEMPVHLQVKLLHVLQNREVQRVGGDRPIRVDVRVMAATNRDLEEEIEAKRFRSDLFYRLSVVALTVPPLRERPEDIPDLVSNYLAHFQQRFSSSADGITDAALQALQAHHWPGNVRELVNVLERALLLCAGEEIDLEDLPETISGQTLIVAPPTIEEDGATRQLVVTDEWLLGHTLHEVRRQAVEDIERRYLVALLRSTEGRIGDAARRADVHTRSLFDRLRQYGIKKETFKPKTRRRSKTS